jgi:hypothetical protein
VYWTYALTLLIASVLMPFAYAILSVPSFVILLVISKFTKPSQDSKKRVPVPLWPLIGVGMLWNFAVLTVWAAFCAIVTTSAASHPSVSQKWLYYATGFMFVGTPLFYMASKEDQSDRPRTRYTEWLVWVLFITFCIWPQFSSPMRPLMARLPGIAAAEGSRGPDQQGISISVREILRRRALFDKAVALLSERVGRDQIGSEFLDYERGQSGKAEGIEFDTFMNAKGEIRALQTYFADDGLVMLVLLTGPNAASEMDSAAKMAHDATDIEASPPSKRSRLYYLGNHRLGPNRLIKAMLRKDTIEGSEVYSVNYAISEE